MTLLFAVLVQLVIAPLFLLFPMFAVAIQYERGGWWRLLLPLYAAGGLLDLWLNVSTLALFTWDLPTRKEVTFSQRLERLVFDRGWRGKMARPIARYLNFFDPSPPHVRMPEQT